MAGLCYCSGTRTDLRRVAKSLFPLQFSDQILAVNKIQESDFTATHHELLSEIKYHQQALHSHDSRWSALYLGAGEEKAVFCVCDHERRVFAVELIDERHYLNGRFVGGQYFFNKRIKSLTNVRANPDSEFGLTFTGLIKVREFAYGYEWARFQFDPRKKTWLDSVLTGFLQSALIAQFTAIRHTTKTFTRGMSCSRYEIFGSQECQ